ncbi:hypothetical protein ILUMI_18482, partial [Ignelater luminosus]
TIAVVWSTTQDESETPVDICCERYDLRISRIIWNLDSTTATARAKVLLEEKRSIAKDNSLSKD